MTLERSITFAPAYDRRDPDPSRNYGIHGVTMTWYVKGPEGAIQWVLYTDWHLQHVRQELSKRYGYNWSHGPMPADLGFHSPRPIYEGQTMMSEPGECEHVPAGAPCYYDGSGLNADPVFDLLCAEGEDAVWKYLEAYYADVFEAVSA